MASGHKIDGYFRAWLVLWFYGYAPVIIGSRTGSMDNGCVGYELPSMFNGIERSGSIRMHLAGIHVTASPRSDFLSGVKRNFK
jgi:hypothetical protein